MSRSDRPLRHTVRSVEMTCDFYSQVFKMEGVEFEGGRRVFESDGIRSTACLVTEVPLGRVAEYIRSCGVEIFEGPVSRLGATGRIASIYLRDLDGNLIEVSNYADDVRG